MKSIFRYHFIPKSNINNTTLTPIYKSSIPDQQIKDFQQSYVPFKEYFQLAPIFLDKFFLRHKKQFVIDLQYSKQADLLQLTCLNYTGIYTKIVSPHNVIPCTFADYKQSCAFNLFEHTKRVDYQMIYFNRQQEEFYLFDREGKWTEEDVDGLSLERLFDEKKYLNEHFR